MWRLFTRLPLQSSRCSARCPGVAGCWLFLQTAFHPQYYCCMLLDVCRLRASTLLISHDQAYLPRRSACQTCTSSLLL
uniref:Uncharacterized protein n=1 Tax=Ixodes ricinus TaxID=34613 RepID=A0A6B0U5F9_IXORI